MAEVLRSFTEPIRDAGGSYHARVVGRAADDGMWEGWLEFVSETGVDPEPLVTPVESRQPEREHLVYWASGLSVIYAEGALRRAKSPVVVRTRIVETPLSQAPAEKVVTRTAREAPPGAYPILDPFEVGGRSLDILAQELGALGRGRLLNIIAAYHLNPAHDDLSTLSEQQLIQWIVTAVESRLMLQRRV
jgi:hypothetical protein